MCPVAPNRRAERRGDDESLWTSRRISAQGDSGSRGGGVFRVGAGGAPPGGGGRLVIFPVVGGGLRLDILPVVGGGLRGGFTGEVLGILLVVAGGARRGFACSGLGIFSTVPGRGRCGRLTGRVLATSFLGTPARGSPVR